MMFIKSVFETSFCWTNKRGCLSAPVPGCHLPHYTVYWHRNL
jgi:hypothetical protein